MSTIVGTNIEVTNIKYDSDTTAMIVSSAGGGAGTVPQGLTKAWAGINASASLEGSFNISSGDDDGAGNYGLNFTSNMSDANYSSVNTAEFSHNGSTQNPRYTVTNSRTTSSVEVDGSYINSSSVFIYYDLGDIGVQVNGDLA